MSNNLIHQFGGSLCLGRPGWAEGTNANTIQAAAAFNFAIDGVVYAKSITDNIAMTPASSQANLTTCLYGIDIDAAGAVTLVKGREVLTADITSGATKAPLPEGPSATKCRVGIMKIVNTSGAAFVVGTTDLGVAGITDTFYNVAGQPANLALFS